MRRQSCGSGWLRLPVMKIAGSVELDGSILILNPGDP
jgi:hypothetical protein